MSPSVQVPGAAAAHWQRTLPALVLALAAVVVLYRDTALAMVSIWARSDTFAHCFVVLPIASWLIWRQRHALAAQVPVPTAWVLGPIALMGLVWLLGQVALVNAATQFAFTGLIVLVVVAMIGTGAARTIAFPLGYLFFAVPIGEFLMPQLMLWTADFTVFALRASGIPVYREGLRFVIPSGHWSVVEACSGVRYLMASVTVGVLFAYLNYRTTRRRLLFVGVAIAVPIVANWLRAYLIVLLGHLTDNRLAAGADHLVYGWLFFGVVIVLMFLIGGRWAESPQPPAQPRPPPSGGPRRGAPVWAVAGAVAAMVLVPWLAAQAVMQSEAVGQPTLAQAEPAPGWRSAQASLADWQPAFANPSTQVHETWSSADGRTVGVYVGYYRHQDYGHKLVGSENALIRNDDPHRTRIAGPDALIELGDRTVRLRTAQLRPLPSIGTHVEPLVVWQVYWVNGRLIAGDIEAKLYGVVQRLMGRGDDAAVIVLYTPQEQGGAEALLGTFLRDTLRGLEVRLKRTRDGERSL